MGQPWNRMTITLSASASNRLCQAALLSHRRCVIFVLSSQSSEAGCACR